jgi:hypothetical protein
MTWACVMGAMLLAAAIACSSYIGSWVPALAAGAWQLKAAGGPHKQAHTCIAHCCAVTDSPTGLAPFNQDSASVPIAIRAQQVDVSIGTR